MRSTPSPVRLPQAARRSQLLEAARAEFLAQGYSGARLQTVAKACGVTEALVYKHFESKEELFDAAVMQPLHDLLARRIEDIANLPVDPQGQAQLATTRDFMRTLLATFCESIKPMGVVLFGEPAHAQAFYLRHVRPLIDAAVDAAEATIMRWPHRDYDVRTAMNAAFGMAYWLALDRSFGQSSDPLEVAAEKLADILFHGLKAR